MVLPPDMQWVINPGVITGAIQLLVGTVAVIGGMLFSVGSALIAVLLYVWKKMDTKIDRIATSLEESNLITAVDIAGIRANCAATHANHRREGDAHD